MVTRKSGEGPRNADVGSDRPGSYAKTSGSRKKRKRRGSTEPPPPPSSSLEQRSVVDTIGYEDRTSDPDLASDLVDDLRRGSKPSSNRPRKELGPLGIEDVRGGPAHASGSDRPRVMKVVEINASEAPRRDPFGDEITTESPVSALFGDDEDQAEVPEHDRELAPPYGRDDRDPGDGLVLRTPSRHPLTRHQEDYDPHEPTHSLSSVLGARPSLRPTPHPPQQRDAASFLWWLVVIALVAIIAAAGAIAAREQFANESEPTANPASAAPAWPEPAAPVVSRPPVVAYGTPQTAEPPKQPQAPVRTPAKATAPNVVPPAQSAAVRPGAPYTSSGTGAASAARPNASGPAASAVKPTEQPKPKPVVRPSQPPAANYAPGYGKPVGSAAYAPGYSSDAQRGKPDLAPAPDSRREVEGIPVNPYE